jgi:hypothetical protein
LLVMHRGTCFSLTSRTIERRRCRGRRVRFSSAVTVPPRFTPLPNTSIRFPTRFTPLAA